jgi:hypothetical protein
MKSERNKTIDITIEEGKEYLDKCIKLDCKTELSQILDKTIMGDTFEILKLLPEKSIDLLITDPPYNLNKDFHGNKFKRMSEKDYLDYIEKWACLIKPLLKDNASIYVCCDWYSSQSIFQVLKNHFIVRNRITWQREKGRGSLNNWKNGCEDIWYCTNSENFTFNIDNVKIRRKVIAPYKKDGIAKDWFETESGKYRDTYPSNFWDDISIPYWSMPENTAHPTQKSEKLIAKLILASSNENDVILDTFLGSGTTSVTAKKLNRHYIGIEQNEQYCVWTEKRLEQAESNKNIQGYTGVFWERNTNNLQMNERK